jgi:hypothetical protein
MPRTLCRLIMILALVLATAACATKPKTTPQSRTTQTAKKTPSSKPAPPSASSVAQAAPTGGPTSPPPAVGQAPAAFSGEASLQGGTTPTGFGGLPWGASAKSNPGLALQETDAAVGVTTCIWPQGPKTIAGAPIRDAFYEFFQDGFYHVWLDLDGMPAYKAALAELTRTYGPPTEENLEKYYHAWKLGDVNIYCAYHSGENEGDVSFFYQPIYERMMVAKKAASAKRPQRSAKP